jgi:hypothetical protein
MQWDVVFECVKEISGMTAAMPRALVRLRHEVIASMQLPENEKLELHDVLDGLQNANLYGRISLLGKLKEVLSRHEEFKAKYAEFGLSQK